MYEKDNPFLFSQLLMLVQKHPRSYFNMLRTKKFIKIHKWINECVPLLNDPKYKISTKCNWILNNIVDFPRCRICGVSFGKNINLQIHSSYSTTCPKCARKCAAQSTKATIVEKTKSNPHYYDKIIKKRKETNILLHGNSRWNNEEKSKKTCLTLYGVDNVRKTQRCKQKIKATKKEKYGDENYNNIEKFKSTCLANYGVEWPMQDPKIRSKSKSKYKFDGYEFDSKQELCFYIWLRDNKKEFIFKPNIKIAYVFDEKTHWYFPDFIVKKQIVEIKGDYFFKKDGTMQNPYDHSQDALYEAKHQCMLKNNVKIILQSKCSEYLQFVIEKYGKDFIYKCKNTANK